jgi:hypothetical protein
MTKDIVQAPTLIPAMLRKFPPANNSTCSIYGCHHDTNKTANAKLVQFHSRSTMVPSLPGKRRRWSCSMAIWPICVAASTTAVASPRPLTLPQRPLWYPPPVRRRRTTRCLALRGGSNEHGNPESLNPCNEYGAQTITWPSPASLDESVDSTARITTETTTIPDPTEMTLSTLPVVRTVLNVQTGLALLHRGHAAISSSKPACWTILLAAIVTECLSTSLTKRARDTHNVGLLLFSLVLNLTWYVRACVDVLRARACSHDAQCLGLLCESGTN